MKAAAQSHAPIPEFPDSPAMGSPLSQTSRQSPDRRETILNLVEMLLKNPEPINPGYSQVPSFEDDRDVPSVDEHLQAVGAESFYRLQKKINNLDKELRSFANAARQLGSSVAILSSAFQLRDRLAQLLFLFHENAAHLFPRKISHIARESPENPPETAKDRKLFRRVKGKARLHIPRPTVAENVDVESFPDQFEQFSKEVTTFLRCLNEFPEFTDEAVNTSILSFEGDLKYWASCLREYSTQFRYPAVQRYIHDISSEMGEHIEELTSALAMFIEVGVPTIRFAQKHGAENLLNLSTVATFFSAVTATTMQFSFELKHSVIADSVNAFWFASLVFSIAAAVNSLLGLTWKQAMYRSPGHRVPWWVLIWIKRSPLVFLVLSVACFSVGLCCFAYASDQAKATCTLTTVLTAFTSFGLAAVSTWFASERWTFSQHRGQKWLSDVLSETVEAFLGLRGVTWLQMVASSTSEQVGIYRRRIPHFWGKIISCLQCGTRSPEPHDLEAKGGQEVNTQMLDYGPKDRMSPTPNRPSESTAVNDSISSGSLSLAPTPVNSPVNTAFPVANIPNTPTSPPLGKQLWKNAVRNVTMRNALARTTASITGKSTKPRPEPMRQRTVSSGLSLSSDGRVSGQVYTRSRLSGLVPKLMELEATHDLAAHSALVRHMQFSPDGKFLATSSWDKTSVIFRVGSPFTPHRTLAHAQGFVGQVAWSPTGEFLLTKMARGVKVWTAEDGVCKKTINRNTSIESITWFPSGEAFLSIEDSVATKLDLNGKVLEQYDFGDMKLHDVAITPDSSRLVGVGPLLRSPSGLQPSRSRVEKRLVVYNIQNKQIENMTPVLEDVRDITLAQTSRNGLVALVSYEHKAPPQLWKLELVKDRDTNNTTTSRLSLRHTYMPKGQVDFAGSSYFGGENNELVLCAGKAGDIHIWDQESGALLHSIRAQANGGGDLTSIAWNHSAKDPFMFATGSHDGGVRVWTRRPTCPCPCPSSSDYDSPPLPPPLLPSTQSNHHHNANTFFLPRSVSGSPYGMPVGSTAFESALSLDEYHSEQNSSPTASQTRLTSTSGRDYPP